MSAPTQTPPISPQALAGLKVIELGQLIAGPFAGRTLADFGAQVIKIEPPGVAGKSDGGDPLRKWRRLLNGTSLWWQVQSRNKQSVLLDLRTQAGQDAVRALALDADVLIENFKPGTLEAWGLGWDALHALNPRLIMLRISGYGQTGPYKDRPGFGVVAEAMGGMRHLTGEPGRVPVRAGISIGDTLAALHGVIGVLLALQHRHTSGQGQMIDVALYEAVFNCMESLLPEYGSCGVVRQPSGSYLPGIAPSNAYPTATGAFVLIAGNGDSIYKRLMHAIGRDDLALDPSLSGNDGRALRQLEIDQAIGQWTVQQTPEQVLAMLDASSVPGGKIYTIEDIANDPQYQARGMLQTITTRDGDRVQVPGIVPKLSATPGAIRSAAPLLGEDTQQVLGRLKS